MQRISGLLSIYYTFSDREWRCMSWPSSILDMDFIRLPNLARIKSRRIALSFMNILPSALVSENLILSCLDYQWDQDPLLTWPPKKVHSLFSWCHHLPQSKKHLNLFWAGHLSCPLSFMKNSGILIRLKSQNAQYFFFTDNKILLSLIPILKIYMQFVPWNRTCICLKKWITMNSSWMKIS